MHTLKTQPLQIAYFLSAYNEREVLEGFKIWNDGIQDGLSIKGWVPVKDKPVGVEFFDLTKVDGNYWVKDEQKLAETRHKEYLKKLGIQNRVLKFFKGLVNDTSEFAHVISGSKVSEEIYYERLGICKKCKFMIKKKSEMYCKPCGCPTWKPAELKSKLKWARLNCPKGYFKSME